MARLVPAEQRKPERIKAAVRRPLLLMAACRQRINSERCEEWLQLLASVPIETQEESDAGIRIYETHLCLLRNFGKPQLEIRRIVPIL